MINTLVGGAILNHETEYSKGGHRYAIDVRLLPDQREEVPSLDRIKVRNNRGEMVPVSALVDKQIKPSLILISRLNRSRAITVYANPAPAFRKSSARRN